MQAEVRGGRAIVALTEFDSIRNLTFPNPPAIDLPDLYRSYNDYLQISYDLVRRGVRFGNNNWTPVRARSFAEPVERIISTTSDQLASLYARGLFAVGEATPPEEMALQIEKQNLMARINLPMGRVEVREVTVPLDVIPLEVLPLPTEGRPADFSGAIGDFALVSKVVPTKAAVNEPVTWTLELAGPGNWPDLTGLPSREVSNDFQVVQPKAKRTPTEGKLFDVTLSDVDRGVYETLALRAYEQRVTNITVLDALAADDAFFGTAGQAVGAVVGDGQRRGRVRPEGAGRFHRGQQGQYDALSCHRPSGSQTHAAGQDVDRVRDQGPCRSAA